MKESDDNSWNQFVQRIKSPELAFSLNHVFDKVIAEKFPSITDQSRSGLRTNIAVLRETLPPAQGLAPLLGTALATGTVNPDIASIEGVGAAEMYKFLLTEQTKSGFTDWLKSLLGLSHKEWNLPPLSQTPFSPENLLKATTPIKSEKPEDDFRDMAKDALDQIVILTAEAVNAVNTMQSIETLTEPVKAEAVEEARNILRWMRNMEFTDRDVEEWLDQGTPAVKLNKKQSLQKLVVIFALHLRQAMQKNPESTKNNPAIQNAANAAAAMAWLMAEHTRALLADDDPRLPALDALIDSLPPDAELRGNQPISKLLDTLEFGLEQLTGRQVGELTAAERLAEAANRTQAVAYQLQSIEPMGDPAREESIMLARDILRRLKNPHYGEQTLGDFIEKGKTEDKTAFAQTASDAAESYKNLVAEAATSNPDIRSDPAIKTANDAFGTTAHAIKLMAAKEMPGSIAAAQQISSEAAAQPEQWKNVDKNVVNRIIKSAEGGVEKAIEEISKQQEQDQEKDEEMQQEAVESAQLSNDQSKRRKRRRGGGGGTSRSGKGGKKQEKLRAAHSADDRVLKQGQHAEDVKVVVRAGGNQTAPIAGLNADALAAVRNLGGSLLNLENQVKSMTNVTSNDKITPDGKSNAERTIEKEKEKHKRGPKGTGV